jgi:hypothetical protein
VGLRSAERKNKRPLTNPNPKNLKIDTAVTTQVNELKKRQDLLKKQ